MSRHPPAASRPALEGRSILLLEDESLIVLDLTLALERRGARVLSMATVARALELLEVERPDAAILDLRLGRGESSEPVTERLEALDIPFLLHTGDTLRQQALITRFADLVLHKPCPSHELVRRLARLIPDDR